MRHVVLWAGGSTTEGSCFEIINVLPEFFRTQRRPGLGTRQCTFELKPYLYVLGLKGLGFIGVGFRGLL